MAKAPPAASFACWPANPGEDDRPANLAKLTTLWNREEGTRLELFLMGVTDSSELLRFLAASKALRHEHHAPGFDMLCKARDDPALHV